MSELKEHLFVPYSELQEGDELTDAFTIAKSYYCKSETDKLLAELEESHKMEVEQLLMEIVELKEIDSKNRSAYYKDLAMMAKDVEHHKYKRCLAMSKLCLWKMGVFIYKKEKIDFYYRWYKRWLELAKKANALCKEAK